MDGNGVTEQRHDDPGSSLGDRFGANLRKARDAAGLSIEELAEQCGLHWTQVERLERGRHEPRLTTIVRLASVLNVAPESLWADPA
jgi:transcriptional regulator with XRE-family HTH domain